MAKLILQHKVTQQYFKNLEQWTPDVAEALDFVSAEIALRFCKSRRVKNVALISFDEQTRRVLERMHLCSWLAVFCFLAGTALAS